MPSKLARISDIEIFLNHVIQTLPAREQENIDSLKHVMIKLLNLIRMIGGKGQTSIDPHARTHARISISINP